MNSLADLLKRLNHISEAADEKCPKCDCAPCECDDKDKVDESKKKKPDADGDGIPDWADEDNNKKEVKETALSLLRRYAGIQEAKIEEDDVEEGNEFSGALKAAKDAGEEEFEVGGKKYKVKESAMGVDYDKVLQAIAAMYGDDMWENDAMQDLAHDLEQQNPTDQELDSIIATGKLPQRLANTQFTNNDSVKFGESEMSAMRKMAGIQECGDMPMANQMSPMTAVTNMGVPAQIEMPHAEIEVEPESEQRPMFTLNVRNGDNNLSMTTDSPDEIIHVMKLAGVNKTAEITKTPADDQDKEVDESGYANTPNNTRERDPKSYGNIQDWGMKGTATAKTHSIPAKQGDNPLGEQAMMEDYKKFKSGK